MSKILACMSVEDSFLVAGALNKGASVIYDDILNLEFEKPERKSLEFILKAVDRLLTIHNLDDSVDTAICFVIPKDVFDNMDIELKRRLQNMGEING
jgi:hypothetical protein